MQNAVLKDVNDLLALAKRAKLLAASADADEFIQALDAYLSGMEKWQAQFESQAAADQALYPIKDQAKPLLEELNALHGEIVQLVAENRDRIGAVLGGVHKRTQGLKRYIDPHPSRITIAGKREG